MSEADQFREYAQEALTMGEPMRNRKREANTARARAHMVPAADSATSSVHRPPQPKSDISDFGQSSVPNRVNPSSVGRVVTARSATARLTRRNHCAEILDGHHHLCRAAGRDRQLARPQPVHGAHSGVHRAVRGGGQPALARARAGDRDQSHAVGGRGGAAGRLSRLAARDLHRLAAASSCNTFTRPTCRRPGRTRRRMSRASSPSRAAR